MDIIGIGAGKGDKQALTALRAKMNSEQINAAERLAEEFKKRKP
jgi:hypothetical protein